MIFGSSSLCHHSHRPNTPQHNQKGQRQHHILEPGIVSDEDVSISYFDDDNMSTHSESPCHEESSTLTPATVSEEPGVFLQSRQDSTTMSFSTGQSALNVLADICCRVHAGDNIQSERDSLPHYSADMISGQSDSTLGRRISALTRTANEMQTTNHAPEESSETILAPRKPYTQPSSLQGNNSRKRTLTCPLSQSTKVDGGVKRQRKPLNSQEDELQVVEPKEVLPVMADHSKDKKERQYVYVCKDYDVICRMDKGESEPFGNTYMARNALLCKAEYMASSNRSPKDKTEIARRVMTMQNGQFLDKDEHGFLYVADEKKALAKIKCVLRDSQIPKWAFQRGVCGWKYMHKPTGKSFLLQKRLHHQWIGCKWSEVEADMATTKNGGKRLPQWAKQVPKWFRSDAWADVETCWYLEGEDALKEAFDYHFQWLKTG